MCYHRDAAMGPLIDAELERTDRRHAQLTRLSHELVRLFPSLKMSSFSVPLLPLKLIHLFLSQVDALSLYPLKLIHLFLSQVDALSLYHNLRREAPVLRSFPGCCLSTRSCGRSTRAAYGSYRVSPKKMVHSDF